MKQFEEMTLEDKLNAMFKMMQEDKIKIVAVQTSADCEAWMDQAAIDIAGLMENLAAGERVFVRTLIQERLGNGKRTSLPKLGAIFELTATEIERPRIVPVGARQIGGGQVQEIEAKGGEAENGGAGKPA